MSNHTDNTQSSKKRRVSFKIDIFNLKDDDVDECYTTEEDDVEVVPVPIDSRPKLRRSNAFLACPPRQVETDTFRLNQEFLYACSCGTLEKVVEMLDSGWIDPNAGNHMAILMAVINGHHHIVRYLSSLHGVDLSFNDNEAIRYAVNRGDLAMIEILLSDSRVDPSASNNEALRLASFFGYHDIVERLSSVKRDE
jgi:hypothetical protein